MAACGPPGGGRNVMTGRLVRHFVPMWCPETDEQGMRRIFGSILRGFLDLQLQPIVQKARASMEADAATMAVLSKAAIDLDKQRGSMGSAAIGQSSSRARSEQMFSNALVAAAVDL